MNKRIDLFLFGICEYINICVVVCILYMCFTKISVHLAPNILYIVSAKPFAIDLR